MKNTFFLILSFFIICSCVSKKIAIYNYDNSKYDGAEIYCNGYKAFFNKQDHDIILFSIEEEELHKEFLNIKRKIKALKNKPQNCHGYLYYAFISKNDTLYSDYDLNYWRDKNNGVAYKLDKKAKEEIKKKLTDIKVSILSK